MQRPPFTRPRALRPGDVVEVVAPAGPVPADRFAAGCAKLANRYQLRIPSCLTSPNGEHGAGFLAGSDDHRAAELHAALSADDSRTIWAARGGYGALRIAPRLASIDRSALVGTPRLIIGFSDVTIVHAWAASQRVATVHGPVLTQLGELPDEDVAACLAVLESPAPPPPLTGLTTLAGGRAHGLLLGGNLATLASLVGTPFFPRLDGAVVLLEDVGERPYRVDRFLTQLLWAGAFDGVAGFVLGDFVRCEDPQGQVDVRSVLEERLARLGVPVLAGAPIGHGARNRAVPLGGRVELDGALGVVEFLDAAVD